MHHNVDADLVLVHALVRLQLGGEPRQDHLAHHVGEDRGSPCDLAETVLMHTTAGPGAKAVTTKTSLVEGVEQVGRVGHESGGFLDRVPALGFLAVHVLVGADTLNSR